jgi:hypothetical protein
MKIEDYRKACNRKIESLEDLDSTTVRRIKHYLSDHTFKQTAERWRVPLHIVREIEFRAGEKPTYKL